MTASSVVPSGGSVRVSGRSRGRARTRSSDDLGDDDWAPPPSRPRRPRRRRRRAGCCPPSGLGPWLCPTVSRRTCWPDPSAGRRRLRRRPRPLILLFPWIDELHYRSVRPQSFEVVVLAVFLVKNVHHEVHVVEQDPPAFALSFSTEWFHSSFGRQCLGNLVGDGLHLTVGITAADEEMVGYDQLLGD